MNGKIKNTFEINIGPQHPSTHGVLRMIAELDGEKIVSLEPVIGYLHRGLEKMAEERSYLQYLPIVDRVDYLSGFFCSYAYIDAVEKSLNINVPLKAQYIRVLTMELNRICSHLIAIASLLMDLGATSPFFYCYRERETILNIFEDLTGARMMYNYYTFGGVKFDVPLELLDRILKFSDDFTSKIKEYENIITNNPVFLDRTKGIGIITQKQVADFALTGVNARSSNVNFDLRRDESYLIYDDIRFDVPVSSDGDAWTRYKLRIKELEESRKIVVQCATWLKNNIEEKEICVSVNSKTISLSGNISIGKVESPRGELQCVLYPSGDKMPDRIKWRTPSFYAVQILPKILKGKMYGDIMATFGSLDVIMPEVDR